MSAAIAETLPSYEPMLSAYHRAFSKELRQIVRELPIRPTDLILDMGCGDGFYSRLLASRLDDHGRLIAADSSDEYLKLTAQKLKRHLRVGQISFVKTDISALRFPSEVFDLCWCAQSLYSFPDPVKALLEMKRVTRRHGLIAILENDSIHQIILPWPPDIELKLREAELRIFQREHPNAEKFYVGRDLVSVFKQANVTVEKKRSYSWDRMVPMDAASREFVEQYLHRIREKTLPELGDFRKDCEPYLDPDSESYLLNSPSFSMTIVDQVVWGRV